MFHNLKIYSFSAILLILALCPVKSEGSDSSQAFDEYKRLNDAEMRLLDYKDSDTDLELKINQLEIINKSRRRYNSAPLKLDILASRVANKICREAALNNYVGHWNLSGEKPYLRYSNAGGVDHISENASGEMTTGRYSQTPETISSKMVDNHNAFMSERKPDDGHKQTVIAKYHNYVGIGFYITKNQFRYYELYIDRYFEFENVPGELKVGEEAILRCKPAKGHYINLLMAYYENLPKPVSAAAISSRNSYNDYSETVALEILPWDISNYMNGSWYEFPLKFEKPGTYYLHIYSDVAPYRDGDRFSTEGKLQASGVVVTVYR